MPKIALSPNAAIAAGSIYTYLRPRLAQDAKIDMKGILAPMRGRSFKSVKTEIANACRSVTMGKLAQDADIDDVAELLDAIENVVDTPAVAVPEGMGEENGEHVIRDEEDDDPDSKVEGGAVELVAKVREFLKDRVSDEVLQQFDQLVGSGQEPEELDDDKGEDNRMGRDEDKDEKPVTQKAMDAAIAAAAKSADDRHRGIREAERAVRPYVGELQMAFDSADQVFQAALKHLGVKDVEKIHPSAYSALLAAQPKPGTRNAPKKLGMDNALPASVKPLTERIPGLSNIARM